MPTYNFSPFPVITTDVEEMFFMRSDPGLLKYIKRVPCQSLDEAAAFIRKLDDTLDANEGIPWAISLRGDDKLIGCIGIWRFQKENQRGEIGYTLHPDLQGRGFMTEALAAAVHYGFHAIGLHSIEANTDPENIGSHKVLERNGFVREGHIRENHFFDGEYFDTVIYSLITPLI